MRREPALAVLSEVRARRSAGGEPPVNPYTDVLVSGVVEHREEIDEQLSTFAIGWTLDRMPVVDRNILRLGAFELLYATAVPTGVAVSEAVVLAKDLSTDESPRFINGLLSRLAQLRASADQADREEPASQASEPLEEPV